jgi:hypothetical protein
MHNAMDMIANGSAAAPSYVNPKNAGKPLPLARMLAPQAPAGAGAPLTPEEEERQRLMARSPWLA